MSETHPCRHHRRRRRRESEQSGASDDLSESIDELNTTKETTQVCFHHYILINKSHLIAANNYWSFAILLNFWHMLVAFEELKNSGSCRLIKLLGSK